MAERVFRLFERIAVGEKTYTRVETDPMKHACDMCELAPESGYCDHLPACDALDDTYGYTGHYRGEA